MDKLLWSAIRAIRSLFSPGMPGIFVKSIFVTIAALIGFVVCSSLFFGWLGQALHGYAIASLLPWLGSMGAGVIAWFLFPGIMPVIIHFFDEGIASVIEQHDYPGTPHTPEQPFWPKLTRDLRFAFVAIGLNLLVLPLYLLPGLNLILFYLLNGYLLGREFFAMVARRHLPPAESEALYRANRTIVVMAGIGLAAMATVPVANLFAPFWGIAVMVHLYHRLEPLPRIERIEPRRLF